MRGKDKLMRLIESEISDHRVIDAFRSVARVDYVPKGHEAAAYDDRPVPLPQRQTTSQPSLIARMVEAAVENHPRRVLEVGTGYGFQTALLAQLVDEVVSVERVPELASQAQKNLAARGIDNTTVVVGDGWKGWPERAPYDAIVVSAAADEMPHALADQLNDHGRLVVPLKRGWSDDVIVFVKRGDVAVEDRTITPARFVPLVRGAADA